MASSVKSDEFIVVAEDSAPNRTILVLLLKKLGFGVLECEDGSSAWKAMEKNRDKKVIAVISDMMMPNMDGMELLRRIRGDSHYADLPSCLLQPSQKRTTFSRPKNCELTVIF
jgi:CheY-like chemotaxis protein